MTLKFVNELTVITPFEQLSSPTLGLRLINFDEVNINEVSYVVYVKSLAVLINQSLVEIEHF